MASCGIPGLMKRLEAQQKQLEVCEKALADYMESKRRAFPRFYFVSTADLLDILSNGNNPVHVMQHMSKCFQVRSLGPGYAYLAYNLSGTTHVMSKQKSSLLDSEFHFHFIDIHGKFGGIVNQLGWIVYLPAVQDT